MMVISKEIYGGKDIEDIRYESVEHMSGWWIITDDYDDNIETLMAVHFHHVVFKNVEDPRYNYFIRKVAEFEQFWKISGDCWGVVGDKDGNRRSNSISKNLLAIEGAFISTLIFEKKTI